MWSRRTLCAFLVLAGCGLTPAGGTDRWQNAVVVDAPNSVLGFRMAQRLSQVLGAPVQAKYRLTLTPQSGLEPATITEDGDSTRFNLTGNVSWTLVDTAGQSVGAGLEQTFTAYSATGSTVATQSAESDAQARLAVSLADLIVQRMSLIVPPQ